MDLNYIDSTVGLYNVNANQGKKVKSKKKYKKKKKKGGCQKLYLHFTLPIKRTH